MGPGPEHYETSYSKEKQTLARQPRPKFALASRKIDVIKCKYSFVGFIDSNPDCFIFYSCFKERQPQFERNLLKKPIF